MFARSGLVFKKLCFAGNPPATVGSDAALCSQCNCRCCCSSRIRGLRRQLFRSCIACCRGGAAAAPVPRPSQQFAPWPCGYALQHTLHGHHGRMYAQQCSCVCSRSSTYFCFAETQHSLCIGVSADFGDCHGICQWIPQKCLFSISCSGRTGLRDWRCCGIQMDCMLLFMFCLRTCLLRRLCREHSSVLRGRQVRRARFC